MAKSTKPTTYGITHKGELLADYLSKNLIEGDISVPDTGFKFDTMATYRGKQGIAMVGQTAHPKGVFKKRGNATITLANTDPNAHRLVVDTVAYIDPAWVDGVTYPQGTTLEGLAFEGDNNGGEYGLVVLQGGKYSFNNLSFNKTRIALLLEDCWVSDMTNLRAFGKIKQNGGTSTNYINCWASSQDTTEAGAFEIRNMRYMNMIGCASDGTLNTAYVFHNVHGNVLGCGCEGAGTTTADTGTAIAFRDYNQILLSGFTCVPVPQGPEIAFISIGSNNIITIENMTTAFGVEYNQPEIYIRGSNNQIVIRGGLFREGRDPIIQAHADAVGSTITYYRADGKVLYGKVASAGVVTLTSRAEVPVTCYFDYSGGVQRSHGVSRVTKEGTGVYRIHYDTPKENIIAANATTVNANAFATILELTNTYCLLHVRNFTPANADAGVMFSATGWA